MEELTAKSIALNAASISLAVALAQIVFLLVKDKLLPQRAVIGGDMSDNQFLFVRKKLEDIDRHQLDIRERNDSISNSLRDLTYATQTLSKTCERMVEAQLKHADSQNKLADRLAGSISEIRDVVLAMNERDRLKKGGL